jgi:hypothetical protein
MIQAVRGTRIRETTEWGDDPSPREIREMCARIQQGWSEQTRIIRAGGNLRDRTVAPAVVVRCHLPMELLQVHDAFD